MIVVFEEIWPNIRIVTLLHCYVFDFQSAQVCGEAPVVELRSYMITFNVFENDF